MCNGDTNLYSKFYSPAGRPGRDVGEITRQTECNETKVRQKVRTVTYTRWLGGKIVYNARKVWRKTIFPDMKDGVDSNCSSGFTNKWCVS